MTDQEHCCFIKENIDNLEQMKKDEVMACVGQFVLNPKIDKINRQIAMFQSQCKHLEVIDGKCTYCKKQVSAR